MTSETEGAKIRALWDHVEREGLLEVRQVLQTPQWALIVSVPWCRFARELRTLADYERLLERLKREPAAPTVLRAEETQLSLF